MKRDPKPKKEKLVRILLTHEDIERGSVSIRSRKQVEKLHDLIANQGAVIASNLSTIAFPIRLKTANIGNTLHFGVPDEFTIAIVVNRDGDLNGITIEQGSNSPHRPARRRRGCAEKVPH